MEHPLSPDARQKLIAVGIVLFALTALFCLFGALNVLAAVGAVTVSVLILHVIAPKAAP